MKLTVIGCGSTGTPALVEEIIGVRTDTEVREIVLVDPDRLRLATLGAFCQQLLDRADHPAKISTTPELERGADGADAVILRIEVGGSSARLSDLTFPLEHGCVGDDTVGAGGIARAMRTVPLALDIADRVRAVAADDAWLVNATGPVGVVTRALLQDKHRVLGIGGSGDAFAPWVAELLSVSADVVSAPRIGIPQASWARNILITGPNATMDVLPALLAEQADAVGERVGLPGALLRRTGAVPSHRLKYFYRHEETVAEQRDSPLTVDDAERAARLLAEPASADVEDAAVARLLAAGQAARDAADAVRLVAALTSSEPTEHTVTTRNSGLLPFLAQDAVVEAPALVNAEGARTLPSLPLPPGFAGLIAHVTASEAHTLDAAREGSRDAVADALLAHPLIGRYSVAERLTDALLAENQDFLPWAKN